MITINKITDWKQSKFQVYLTYQDIDHGNQFSKAEGAFIQKAIENKQKQVILETFPTFRVVQLIEKNKDANRTFENSRKEGSKLHGLLSGYKPESVCLINLDIEKELLLTYLEGMALSNYQFLKYFKEAEEKKNSLSQIEIFSDSVSQSDCDELNNLVEAVGHTKDLVNEPLSFLTASRFATEMQALGKQAGFAVEVFDKGKIKALKMGGLLAVNKGSIDPPTFTIMEWKPENAKNTKPFVLVGKGIVYDTGGLSLKPTPNSMDYMKCDMAGGAAVAGTLFAIAKNQLPVHVIGLVPATDNRPDGNAYTPGDVITMHSGASVEVLNTDAEGRMILADALSYAKKYDPEFVVDIATLTGSAVLAIGTEGMVGVKNDEGENHLEKLKASGFRVHERIVEMPMWEEYDEMLKSDIADMKNIGGREAGSITAGKFLQRFTDYPWSHLDIAGPAWLQKPESYRGKGATAVTVRLLYDFFKNV